MEPKNRKIIDEKYYYLSNPNSYSDIYQHMPTFRRYADECNLVIEMGTRSVVGTWGFLMGLSDSARVKYQDDLINNRWQELENVTLASNKKLICIDIDHPNIWGDRLLETLEDGANQWGVDFEFRKENTLENEIEECDFLFLDTWHSYDQVKGELLLHGNKSRKYIGFHDTELYGFRDMSGTQGIWPAIDEWLRANPHWYIHEKFANNNGVTILKRKY